jgi:hypothetical protein
MLRNLAAGLLCAAASLAPAAALAWGNDGHRVIALIARHDIDQDPAVAAKVDALLAGPFDPPLPMPGFAELGTWGDRYRDSDAARRAATRQWHFVDIQIGAPDPAAACFGFPALPAGATALDGVADDCVIDKINQFRAELADPATSPGERKVALLFLLHFIGDVHQPLHAAERDHDRGGNSVYVVVGDNVWGTNLHSYWDTNTVSRLGSSPELIAAALLADITPAKRTAWTAGAPNDQALAWANASYGKARIYAYDRLPHTHRSCRISHRDAPATTESCIVIHKTYATAATGQARRQLEMAGVRLAHVIVEALETA